MHKADLKRSLEAELLKIERQDKKIYGVGETRYDLMIRDVLTYIDNSISKEAIEKKIEELKNIKLEKDNELNKVSEVIQKQIGTETDLDSAYQYYDETYDEEQKLIYQINVLQELLEGK